MTLAQKIDTREVFNLLPSELITVVTDPVYFPWLRALPQPTFDRIMAVAEAVRRDMMRGDNSLLDPDLHPRPRFDQLLDAGLAVEITLSGHVRRTLPKVQQEAPA